ncbi:hypothetical protein CLU79DRAFT_734604 [Phycomyces nitens]|nr:hypothetical protein CLU79DRAFT_734604 [Phycomyces nitens]
MSTFIDTRDSPNQPSTFLYSPPPSPIMPPTHYSRDEETKPTETFVSHEENLEFSPRQNTRHEDDLRHGDADQTKRRPPTMKPAVKMPDGLLQPKEQCTIIHTRHPNSVCQHFPCPPKPKYSSLPFAPTPSHTKTRPTAPVDPRPKSQKIKRLKEAKQEYEARIEQYFRQLTQGCGQLTCKNRFCFSSRGSILNLHHQAALMMAIQLASRPDHRFCTPLPSPTIPPTDSRSPSSSRLPSLIISPFLSFFGFRPHQKRSVEIDKHRGSTRRPQRPRHPEHQTDWLSDFWGIWHTMESRHDRADEDAMAEREIDDENDKESYYLLDSDGSSDNLSRLINTDTDTEDGMLLAIRPIAIDQKSADHQLRTFLSCGDTLEMGRWCRGVFQNWEGFGNSFLARDGMDWKEQTIQQVDFNQLKAFFDQLGTLAHAQQQIMGYMAEAFETLLDRMNMNLDRMTEVRRLNESTAQHRTVMFEWARSLTSLSVWIAHFYHDSLVQRGWSTVLTQKYIHILGTIATRKHSLVRHLLLQTISRMHATTLEHLVEHLQTYLLNHFHTGPYKHGDNDVAILTVKCLELLYQASQRLSSPLPPSVFYNEPICLKLNIKEEYRTWKRVILHGERRLTTDLLCLPDPHRRTRLFLSGPTAVSPLNGGGYCFSWFNYPFLFPPSVKRKILHMDAMSQMSLEYEDACVNHTLVVHAQRLLSDAPRMVRNLEANLRTATYPYLLLEIRRISFVQDAWDQVSRKWTDVKKPLKVRFVEGGEEGMDQGGVQKEFFGVLFEKLLSTQLGLFEMDPESRLYWVRPHLETDTVKHYEMTGVMIGLAIYNGIMINLPFPDIFWKVLVAPTEQDVDEQADNQSLFTLSDLTADWPSLASGLEQLLQWPDEVQDVFDRNYEISVEIFGQGVITVPLIPNGESIPVTNANREAFVQDYCTYFMYRAQRHAILALRRGVRSVIGSRALDLFTAAELQVVACGLRQGPESQDLCMEDLESVTDYDDGYHADHPTIRQFWSVVHNSLSPDQKRKLLLFVTASDRVPIGGLKELSFIIQRNGPDSDRLPTALTCFSRLLLPEYSFEEKLEDRLITAIENAKGFGLV